MKRKNVRHPARQRLRNFWIPTPCTERNGQYFDIEVVNMPIGKAVEEFNATDPLVLAVEQVWDAGIVVVIAAGNYGRDGHMTITSPCPMPDGLRCGVTLAPADENQSNRMSMIRTTTILIALLMASTVAAANSDGYFCVGPDYFAYQLVRWDAGDKQDLYVIAFTEWLGNFNQSKTELPSFQIH